MRHNRDARVAAARPANTQVTIYFEVQKTCAAAEAVERALYKINASP